MSEAPQQPDAAAKQNPARFVPVIVLGTILIVLTSVFGPMLCAAKDERELLRHGTPAKAKILKLEDTGNRYNHNPEILLTVEVQPEGGAAFQSTGTKVLDAVAMQQFVVGAMLEVRYDPAEPGHVAVVGLASSDAAEAAPAEAVPAQ